MSNIHIKISKWFLIIFLLESASLFSQTVDLDYQYALIQGEEYKLTKSIKSAFKLYYNLLNINQTDPVASHELAKLYRHVGRFEEAEEFAKKAYMYGQCDPEIAITYSRLLARKSLESSLGALQVCQKQNTDHYVLNREIISRYFQLKSPKKAIKFIKSLSKEDRLRKTYVSLLHIAYLKTAKDEKAYKLLLSLLNEFPEDIKVHRLAFEYHVNHDSLTKAYENFEILESLSPNDLLIQYSYLELMRKEDKQERFKSKLEELIKLDYLTPHQRLNLWDYINQLPKDLMHEYENELVGSISNGNEAYELGNLNIDRQRPYKALKCYKRAFFINPKDAYALHRILIIESERSNDSLQLYAEIGDEFFPGNPLFKWFLGMSFFRQEKYFNTIETLQDLNWQEIEDEGLKIEYLSLLANAYSRTGNANTSKRIYEQLLDIDKHNKTLQNNYAFELAERGENLDLAKQLSELSLIDNKKRAIFLDTYAWILFKNREFKNALKIIKKAYKYDQENQIEIAKHYIQILQALKKHDAVKKLMDQVHSKPYSEVEKQGLLKLFKHEND